MSEIEKCPMCDSDLILSGTAHLYYCCTRCMLRCDRKDLPRIAALLARVTRMEEALGNIAEYWNGDENEEAMADACWHNVEIARRALEEK